MWLYEICRYVHEICTIQLTLPAAIVVTTSPRHARTAVKGWYTIQSNTVQGCHVKRCKKFPLYFPAFFPMLSRIHTRLLFFQQQQPTEENDSSFFRFSQVKSNTSLVERNSTQHVVASGWKVSRSKKAIHLFRIYYIQIE